MTAPGKQKPADDKATPKPSFTPADPPRDSRPRTGRTPRPKSTDDTKSVPPHKDGVITTGMTKLYGTVGVFLSAVDPQCGGAILENAETMAQSLDGWAAKNPAVRRTLLKVLETGEVGAVVAAHAPVIMAIAAHHTPTGKLLSLFQRTESAQPADDATTARSGEASG